MVATIQQIIGKINPRLFAINGTELLKEYGSADKIPAEKVEPKPLSEHVLDYDSSTETLEPVYFFILDLINDKGFITEKLVDNFTSSPGSGHFSELGQRATIMQQQASQALANVNTVLRSILNIIYDLKEFKIRLQSYDDLKSDDKNTTEAARLTLKQIWLDKVDIAKGNSSVKAMALGQAGFQTLLDAFLVVKDEKDADKVDLNERVKRILKPRIQEFNIWATSSEQELRKRYQMERTYLKSQVNSLKLYSRWAKPYLKAAQQLEQEDVGRNPAVVKTFNTILLELTILGKSKIGPPAELGKIKSRQYYACVLVNFTFRGIPQKVAQQSHYAFGGKATVSFTAYSLNTDELDKLKKELDKSDIQDVLKLIEGSTTESLDQMQDEINSFLKEDAPKKEEKKKDQSNPFLALIGHYNKKEKKEDAPKKEEKDTKFIPVKPDTWIEKTHVRPVAEEKAKDEAFDIFDVYKKAHGMPSYT
ncbi:MAG: hypothetical protein ABIA78_04210 [archaeon]